MENSELWLSSKKFSREKLTIEKMTAIFCHGVHSSNGQLSPARITKCKKPFKSSLSPARITMTKSDPDKSGPFKSSLCPSCLELINYSIERIKKCPYALEKPRCAECKIHCYRKDMKARMKEVMKYAGPRMMYRHPWLTFKHYSK